MFESIKEKKNQKEILPILKYGLIEMKKFGVTRVPLNFEEIKEYANKPSSDLGKYYPNVFSEENKLKDLDGAYKVFSLVNDESFSGLEELIVFPDKNSTEGKKSAFVNLREPLTVKSDLLKDVSFYTSCSLAYTIDHLVEKYK